MLNRTAGMGADWFVSSLHTAVELPPNVPHRMSAEHDYYKYLKEFKVYLKAVKQINFEVGFVRHNQFVDASRQELRQGDPVLCCVLTESVGVYVIVQGYCHLGLLVLLSSLHMTVIVILCRAWIRRGRGRISRSSPRTGTAADYVSTEFQYTLNCMSPFFSSRA